MKRDFATTVVVFLLLVALGVATRWMSKAYEPELSNFTATAAVAIFAGFFFKSWIARVLPPVAVLVISNLWLDSYANSWQMGVVYVSMVLAVGLGVLLAREISAWRVAAFAIVPSVLFYLITNCVA